MNAANLHHHDRAALDRAFHHASGDRSLSGGNDMNALENFANTSNEKACVQRSSSFGGATCSFTGSFCG